MRAPRPTLALVALFALAPPAAVLSAAPARAEGVIADRILAVVDGQPITLVAVRRRAAPALRKLTKTPLPAWNGDARIGYGERTPLEIVRARAVLAEALEASIDDLLVERTATALGERVDEATIDRVLDEAAASRRMSRAGLLAHAWEDGYSEADVRAEQRRKGLERIVLPWAYEWTDRGPWPSGDDPESVAVRVAWRKEWLASQREKACIDRRLTP